MKTRHVIASSAVLAVASQLGLAEVKSLSGDELTETYVKDSTIIVAPVKKEPVKKKVVTLTISPGEPLRTETDDASEVNAWQAAEQAAKAEAELAARQKLDEAALQAVANLPPTKTHTINVAGVPGLTVPEGPFTLDQILNTQPNQLPYGNELNISGDTQQVRITIGNLPGVDPIQFQKGFEGSNIQLEPRAAGGFDLILNVPNQ
ncbi:hypothetical protein AAIA72_04870 [Hahella sp. SMD15-11]|uniref:AMIN domain-containing protein n=1 Tax=Thermohahella caldifontis TaxID=3142973 RepID=A0AB39UZT9_9GAMM